MTLPFTSSRWISTLLLAAGIVLGFGTLAIVWLIARPIGILILAITLAEALSPIVSRLQAKLPRTAAILLVYAALIASVFAIAWLIVPTLVDEAQQLADGAPDLLSHARQWLDKWDRNTGGELTTTVSTGIETVAGRLISLPVSIAAAAFEIFAMLFLSIYWLFDEPRLWEFTLSLFPVSDRPRVAHVLNAIGGALGGYVRGVVIDAAIMGVLASLGLLFAGVRFPLVLGVLTMVGELVPYVGPVVSGLVAVGIALLQSPQKAAIALVLYVALAQLEGHVIAPNVMRRQTNLSPVLVLFAFLAGAAIGGIFGAILAIPFAAAIQVLLIEALIPAVRQSADAPDGSA